VLAKANDQAADATVGLGRRILQRIFGPRAAGEVPHPVADLAADPDDPDLQAALRVAIRKLLAEDADLAGNRPDGDMPAGVGVRRLRIVSEPVIDYIRFEYGDGGVRSRRAGRA
jgi:hypothetical protein